MKLLEGIIKLLHYIGVAGAWATVLETLVNYPSLNFGLLASLASSYTTYLAILAQRNKPPQDSSLSVPERRAYYYSALSSQS